MIGLVYQTPDCLQKFQEKKTRCLITRVTKCVILILLLVSIPSLFSLLMWHLIFLVFPPVIPNQTIILGTTSIEDEDARGERSGPQVSRPPFQQARTFDDADLQRNGRVGEGVSPDSYGRGYYTVGRPSNLAYQSRSKSLHASPTAPSLPADIQAKGRAHASGPGGPFWSEEVSASSPRRIPITVRHEPPSQTLPRLSRFNSEGSQSVQNQYSRNASPAQHYQEQYEQQHQQQQQQQQQQQPQQQQQQHRQQKQYHKDQYKQQQESQQHQYLQYKHQPHQEPPNQKHGNQWQPSSSRNIPILPRNTRRFSEEDTASSVYRAVEAAPAKLSSSWQSPGTLQYSPRGPGAYATLPTKGTQQRARQQQQQQNNHFQQQQQPPQQQQKEQSFFDRNGPSSQSSEPVPVPLETYGSLPTIKPLKSSTTLSSLNDTRRSEHTKPGYSYSSSFPGRHFLPAFKTSQSSFEFGDLRDLEHTLDDTSARPRKDYSKPLWANTDFDKRSSQRSSVSSSLGEDGHSPHSDNAVSSSDSRDTIIAKEEKAAADFFNHKRNVNNFSQARMQQDGDSLQEHSMFSYHQGAPQEARSMDYPHGYQMQQSAPDRDPRPQNWLGPPTSPKPGRRVPVTVVHEHSATPHSGHMIDGVRGKGRVLKGHACQGRWCPL